MTARPDATLGDLFAVVFVFQAAIGVPLLVAIFKYGPALVGVIYG